MLRWEKKSCTLTLANQTSFHWVFMKARKRSAVKYAQLAEGKEGCMTPTEARRLCAAASKALLGERTLLLPLHFLIL